MKPTQRHLTRPHVLRTVILVLLGFVLISCGSSDTPPAGESADVPEQILAERPTSISEQDIGLARAAFLSGKADWERAGITTYTLEVGVESIGLVTVEVVDGAVVSEQIDGAEVDQWFSRPLPRTVDLLFVELDRLIAEFETDPTRVRQPEECGYALNARFDSDLGYPTYYDTLSPCDDGVGLTVRVIR